VPPGFCSEKISKGNTPCTVGDAVATNPCQSECAHSVPN
jgi:hypothetical protein